MKDKQDVFVAQELRVGRKHLENFEAIRAVKAVSFAEVMEMIKAGAFANGQSLAALMQFVVWRENPEKPASA